MNLALYRKLFVHRSDVFAEQQENGDYYPVNRELTDADIAAHLAGHKSYGVYVIDPGLRTAEGGALVVHPNTVHYVVFDLDTYDTQALDFLRRAVERLIAPLAYAWDRSNAHRQCLLLEDSGGKGYHMWLFLDAPVAARRARAWAAKVAAEYKQMARTVPQAEGAEHVGWPALEIFPKQDTVQPGKYGNLVKLPFGVHGKTRARSYVVPTPGWATQLEDVRPFPVALIPEPPAEVQRSTRSESGVSPFPCISKILTEGVGAQVRDVAMYHVACYMRAHGVPVHLAADWCLEINERFTPPMDEAQVRKCARSAYEATNVGHGCGADWLEGFCPGGAKCFAPWNVQRKPTNPAGLPQELRRRQ